MRHLLLPGSILAMITSLAFGCGDQSGAPEPGGAIGPGSGGADDGGGPSGSGGAAGQGGGGGPVECETLEDCVPSFDECTMAVCMDGRCVDLPAPDGTTCDGNNSCTILSACSSGECRGTPVPEGTECGGGIAVCELGSCVGIFACTAEGIRTAIAAGGGPHSFDCEGPTEIIAESTFVIGTDVELGGLGQVTLTSEKGSVVLVEEGARAALSGFVLRGGPRPNVVRNRGTLELRGVVVTDGTCGDKDFLASGIVNGDTGSLIISDSIVTNGRGGCLGALGNFGRLTVLRSEISDNDERFGTGIFQLGGSLVVRDSTIARNHGGISVCGPGSAFLANSTISNNLAFGVSSGLEMTVVNSTIVGPRAVADDFWRAVYCEKLGQTRASGTIFQGGCEVGVLSDGHNLESPGNSCGLDAPTDETNVDAQSLKLGPLQDNGGPTPTHALDEGSVAIDRIPAAECLNLEGERLTADQRGEPRSGAMCDVGAFELGP